MLYAIYQKQMIHVDQFDLSFLKEISEAKELFCPDCRKNVLFKECIGKQNHFSHYSLDCSSPFSEPESIEHETGKKAIYHWLVHQFGENDSFVEKKIIETNQRADTFVQSISSAFEYQCSPIQGATWRKRHALYGEANVDDFWILGYSMHKYQGSSSFIHKINPLEEEMLSHHGRIIYYDVLTKHFVFLIPESKNKQLVHGKEYFFKPNEVFYKEKKIQTKYDYFLVSQLKRKKFSTLSLQEAKKTSQFLKEAKEKVNVSEREKVLATKKQINYIKVLLYQTNQKIPYKFNGLLKSEATQIIKELKNKRNA